VPEASIVFDRIADRYDQTRGGMDRGRALAAAVLPELPPGPVLDVGVGTGAVALGLVELGRTVVGVDLSRPMLERAVERLGARVAQADGAALPLRAASVDAVCVVWVLALVADPAGLVAEAARVLRPGGRVAVVANQAEGGAGDLEPFLDRLGTLRRAQDGPEPVARYAEAAGLEVAHVGIADGNPFQESPSELARSLEDRLWSHLWDLDDARWQEVVVPAIEGLRALPEPDRPRDVRGQHPMIVLAKPPG
jgi:SAM-dependent methyltransferase